MLHATCNTPIEPGDEEAEFPEAHPEPLPINLPRELFETVDPLPTTALEWLRRQIDERFGRDRRDTLRLRHDSLYPRKLLIVDNASRHA